MREETAVELLKIARDLTVAANDKNGRMRSSKSAGAAAPEIEKAFAANAGSVLNQFHQITKDQ